MDVRIGETRHGFPHGAAWCAAERCRAAEDRLENAHARIDVLRDRVADLRADARIAESAARDAISMLNALRPLEPTASTTPTECPRRSTAPPLPAPPPRVVYEPVWQRIGGIFDVIA